MRLRNHVTNEAGLALLCPDPEPPCDHRVAGRCLRRWAEGRGPSADCEVPRIACSGGEEGGCSFIGFTQAEISEFNTAGAESTAVNEIREGKVIELYLKGTPWGEMATATGISERCLRDMTGRLIKHGELTMMLRHKPTCLTPGPPCRYRAGEGCKRRWAEGRGPSSDCEIPLLFPEPMPNQGPRKAPAAASAGPSPETREA
jgi:hypothetical protein